MNNSYPETPSNKTEYISQIGKELVSQHGKQGFYKPSQVEDANRVVQHSKVEWQSWAMSIFCSQDEFINYHFLIGKAFDFKIMRSEMLNNHTVPNGDLEILSDAEIDCSWLDLGETNGGFLESLSDFIGEMFD